MAFSDEDVEEAANENGGATMSIRTEREEAMGGQLAGKHAEDAGRGEGPEEKPSVHLGAVSEGPRSRGESSLHQSAGGNANARGIQRGIFETHEERHCSQFMNILFIYLFMYKKPRGCF